MTKRGVALLAAALAGGCVAGPLDVATLDPGSLQNGLVAHWTFDDGAGVTLRDHSGNGHDGTLTGGSWTQGRFDGALRLMPGEYVTVDGFPAATASYAVTLWVNFDAAQGPPDYVTLVSTEAVFEGGWEMNVALAGTPTFHFAYWDNPGGLEYAFFDCPCVTPGRWTHLAAVVDGTALTISFYLDGVLVGAAAARQPISPGTPTLYMGRWRDEGRLFNGALDDVAIWARALTAEEVARLVVAPPPDPR